MLKREFHNSNLYKNLVTHLSLFAQVDVNDKQENSKDWQA